MLHELLSGRRLRFALDIGDRESIPGALARGVREQVLVRTSPVLVAAGVQMKQIGLSQIAAPDELERLAFVARYKPEDFLPRAGERVIGARDGKAMDARFGELVMPRAFLELDRRRVGPRELTRQNYHRVEWLNLLLPYCPESLERLVDTCPSCKEVQGWRHTQGIGFCDLCEQPLTPSDEPPLPDDLADDYRLFARLSSPHAAGVINAVSQLSPALAGITPGSLVRLALLLGGVVVDEPRAFSRHTVADIPAPVLAAVTSQGTVLLRSWPTGLHRWVAAESDKRRGSPVALEALRVRLRRLGDRQTEQPEIVEAVAAALPNLSRHAAHGISQGRRYYLYKDVQRLLGISSPQMEALKNWKGISFNRLSTATGKEQGQFDVEQIDGLRPAFRDTIAMNSCTGRFGLPLYAIEQLCAAGLLEWEDNEAVLLVGASSHVRVASVDRLTASLVARAQATHMPQDCVTLSVATNRFGGRLKPRASIIDALRTGGMPFWLGHPLPTKTSIILRASDLAGLDQTVDDASPDDLTASPFVSQKDASDILNISTPLLSSLILPFERRGYVLATCRIGVLTEARRFATNAEVAQHLRVNAKQVEDVLAGRIRAVRGGWCRRDLIDNGILPALAIEQRGPGVG